MRQLFSWSEEDERRMRNRRAFVLYMQHPEWSMLRCLNITDRVKL